MYLIWIETKNMLVIAMKLGYLVIFVPIDVVLV